MYSNTGILYYTVQSKQARLIDIPVSILREAQFVWSISSIVYLRYYLMISKLSFVLNLILMNYDSIFHGYPRYIGVHIIKQYFN